MWKYSLILLFNFCCADTRAILTDIEGTTTSISFVHDTLFPYAKEHVGSYLLAHREEAAVSALIDEVAQITALTELSEVIQVLLTWMEQDKKITPLKSLQGMIWKEGFEQGAFKGHVYPDAFQELKRWKEEGLDLYVYSSGSVAAQKLLFGYSTYGDLTPLFSGYFDTHFGGKKESSSYKKIAEYLNLNPEAILFLSDMIEELNAASDAGMQTMLVERGEAIDPINCPHPIVKTFSQVFNE